MTPTFQDEVQLAGWSETHTGGAKVTFWLPDAAALDVFRTLTSRKGNTAGHRFACVLVEIGDDEQTVQPEPEETKGRGKLGDLCWRAVQWCSDAEFYDWINSTTHNGILWHVTAPEGAKEFICELCEVRTRKELDTNPAAGEKFNRLIRGPYHKHLQARGLA